MYSDLAHSFQPKTDLALAYLEKIIDAENAATSQELGTHAADLSKTIASPETHQQAIVPELVAQEYIHLSKPQTMEQQYLSLDHESLNQLLDTPHYQVNPIDDPQALERLLAQNGSLFNGAVGGMEGGLSDLSAQKRLRSSRDVSQRNQKSNKIAEVFGIATDLDLTEHDFEDSTEQQLFAAYEGNRGEALPQHNLSL